MKKSEISRSKLRSIPPSRQSSDIRTSAAAWLVGSREYTRKGMVTGLNIKMADVARYLGVSKATVSLAVNGKPGVNEQTRNRILKCIEEMERNDGKIMEAAAPEPVRSFRMIKIIIINHRKQVICDPELDLWSDVLGTFDTEARRKGYLCGLTYLNETEDNWQEIIGECNLDMVAGVILFGTEMSDSDYWILEQIRKPLVIYDYEMPDGSFSSVCIDNARAVELSLELLEQTDVRYLGTGKSVYNFERRREAFQNSLLQKRGFSRKEDIIPLGNTIGEITERAADYLRTQKLPAAFVLENYQVSIGVLTAARRLRIAVPEDLKLVGIDEVPEYIIPDIKLTQIRIPHAERAVIAMSLLDEEINKRQRSRLKVFAVPELIAGKSV